VPGFESIIDQDRPIRILTTFLQKGTIAHALLFSGTEGAGKERAAIAFAMACNCTGDRSPSETESMDSRHPDQPGAAFQSLPLAPCGVCKSCRKIDAGSHPDIIRVKPSGSFIKIDQIRSLCQTLAMKPYEARIRVVIISDAQAMNLAAGNALLKALEEPPARTILILVAAHPSDLMPTIVSRCQHIRFNPLTRKMLESVLVREHGLDVGDAAVITAMANGSLSRALHMYRTNWINRRSWLISELNSLSNGPINRLLAFSDQLSKNKDDLPDALEVIKSWLRDLVVAKLYPDKILNQDLAPKLRQASQQMSQSSLFAKLEIIQSTQRSLQAGTNLRLAMEAMVLKLSRV
jgi:DNA polymerase-3 subunit delta'